MNKPITITMAGGLGNQLFQFAAGTFIEEKMGRNVIYDISNLKNKTKSKIGNYTRAFELKDLIPQEKVVSKKINNNLNSFDFFLQKQIQMQKLLIENGPNDNIVAKINDKTIRLNGFFQNSNIVEEIWPTIKEIIGRSKDFNSLVNFEKTNQIAIHLRFGDYREDPKTKAFHGLTNMSYYADAINELTLSNKNLQLLQVITDDIEQAKINSKNFSSNLQINFSSNKSPLMDLLELAKSSHVVISNSTFAWWGAWFAFKGCNAEVIYPRPWFADYLDVDIPIYVEEWKPKKRDFEI